MIVLFTGHATNPSKAPIHILFISFRTLTINSLRRTVTRIAIRSFIDFFPVPNGDHKYDQHVVFNGIENPIVALSQTVLLKTGEFLGLGWAGIIHQ